MISTTSKISGMITARSRLAALRVSRASASLPPTRLDLGEGAFGFRRRVDHHRPARQPGIRSAGAGDALNAGRVGQRLLHLRGRYRTRDHDRGIAGARREMRGQGLESGHRFGLHPELFGLREPDVDGEQPGRAHHQCGRRAGCHQGAPFDHSRRDRMPDAGLGHIGSARLGHEGPEHLPAAQRQRGRQAEQHEHHHDQQPGGSRCAQAAGARYRRQQEDQQCGDDGEVAGEDGGPSSAAGVVQRAPVVGFASQFVAIPRHQQQRVVGARTEDQHAGDARGGAVEAELGQCGQSRADAGGDPVGETDNEQRDQPQHRRPVGDDQQDRHDGRGDRKQGGIRAGERVGDIGAEGRPAGHLEL
jgi:hypothetical protein